MRHILVEIPMHCPGYRLCSSNPTFPLQSYVVAAGPQNSKSNSLFLHYWFPLTQFCSISGFGNCTI